MIELQNLKALEVKLTFTLSYEELVRLEEQLPDAWPSWRFAAVLRETIVRARKGFESTSEVNE